VIADIGGGTGALLAGILDAYPSCRGILFDLPEAVSEAIPHVRAERVGGSFFEGVPPGPDVYVLKSIVHDWAEPKAQTILSNVRKVIQSGGRVALVESVITDSPASSMGKWTDLHMLVVCGGEERTADEFSKLLGAAGFELEEIVPAKSPVSIVIGKPR
jgi:hypothetical protein